MDLIERNLWKSGNGKAVNIPSFTLKDKKQEKVHIAVMNEEEFNFFKDKKGKLPFSF